MERPPPDVYKAADAKPLGRRRLLPLALEAVLVLVFVAMLVLMVVPLLLARLAVPVLVPVVRVLVLVAVLMPVMRVLVGVLVLVFVLVLAWGRGGRAGRVEHQGERGEGSTSPRRGMHARTASQSMRNAASGMAKPTCSQPCMSAASTLAQAHWAERPPRMAGRARETTAAWSAHCLHAPSPW